MRRFSYLVASSFHLHICVSCIMDHQWLTNCVLSQNHAHTVGTRVKLRYKVSTEKPLQQMNVRTVTLSGHPAGLDKDNSQRLDFKRIENYQCDRHVCRGLHSVPSRPLKHSLDQWHTVCPVCTLRVCVYYLICLCSLFPQQGQM